MNRGLKISLLISAFFVFAHVEAHAQAANALDSVVTTFRTQASGWQNALTAFAKNTFMILAGVEITVAAIKLAFKNCDASEWLAEIVNQRASCKTLEKLALRLVGTPHSGRVRLRFIYFRE